MVGWQKNWRERWDKSVYVDEAVIELQIPKVGELEARTSHAPFPNIRLSRTRAAPTLCHSAPRTIDNGPPSGK